MEPSHAHPGGAQPEGRRPKSGKDRAGDQLEQEVDLFGRGVSDEAREVDVGGGVGHLAGDDQRGVAAEVGERGDATDGGRIGTMNKLIKAEEAAMLLLSIFLWAQLHFAWYWWLIWILAPDLSMLAYLGGNRVGAIGYNLVHHKGVAIGVYLLGWWLGDRMLEGAGMILFGIAVWTGRWGMD